MGVIPPLAWLDKVHIEPTGCWSHENKLNTEGYNVISGRRQGGPKMLKAHRVMYEWLVGPIPEGLQIDHLCRNRWCLNPSHMEPVTNRENGCRGVGPCAVNARKTHCPKCGRPLAHPNLFVERDGGRRCRSCRMAYQVRYRTTLAS